jgi:vacuolar-type H+-ATPase subunit I/STV1
MACDLFCGILYLIAGSLVALYNIYTKGHVISFLFRSKSFYLYILMFSIIGVAAMIAIELLFLLGSVSIGGYAVKDIHVRSLIEGIFGRSIVGAITISFGSVSQSPSAIIAKFESDLFNTMTDDETNAGNDFVRKAIQKYEHTTYNNIEGRITTDLEVRRIPGGQKEAFIRDLNTGIANKNDDADKIYIALNKYLWNFGKSNFENVFFR